MAIKPANLILLLLSAFAYPARQVMAQPGDPIAQLIEQGNYWRAHQRSDLAEDAWQRVLTLRPNNPDALWGLGMAEADLKRTDQALAYFEKLRQTAPAYGGIEVLAERLGIKTRIAVSIGDARRLAAAGQYDAAVQKYKETFNGASSPPSGIALEFYQTLAGTKDGWDAARKGLLQLTQDNTSDANVALAYGQILSYNTSTWREGIEILERLITDTNVGDAARRSTRKALLWRDAKPADATLFNIYLAVVPGDQEVRDAMALAEKRASIREIDEEHGREIHDGFIALKANQLDEAQRKFEAALARRNDDTDALGGLGLVRLRQERFGEASKLLDRAAKGGAVEKWNDASRSATYWSLVKQADALRSSGRHDEAVQKTLERAIRLERADSTATDMLATIRLDAGDAAQAEVLYRDALEKTPLQVEAVRGLLKSLIDQKRFEEAMRFSETVPPETLEKAGGIGWVRAQIYGNRAADALREGDVAGAQYLFEQAVASDPTSPWIKVELGEVYVSEGEISHARRILDEMTARSDFDDIDTVRATVLLCGILQDWAQGLALLERVPHSKRTASLIKLQRSFWIRQTVSTIAGLDITAAEPMLQRALTVAAGDTISIMVVASAYADEGEDQKALALGRSALAMTSPDDIDARLEYVNLLMKVRKFSSARSVLGRLSQIQLNSQQMIVLGKLKVQYQINESDWLRQHGDLARAYDALVPGLRSRPGDPGLQAALARLYAADGDYGKALELYATAQQRRAGDVGLALEVAWVATASGRTDYAKREAKRAIGLSPNDPRTLAEAGRILRTLGDTRLAVRYLRRALAVDAAGSTDDDTNGDEFGEKPRAEPQGYSNPFAGKGIVGVVALGALLVACILVVPSTARADEFGQAPDGAQMSADSIATGDAGPTGAGWDSLTSPRQVVGVRAGTHGVEPWLVKGNDQSSETGTRTADSHVFATASDASHDYKEISPSDSEELDAADISDPQTGARTSHMSEVRRELADIDSAEASTFSAGVQIRNRQGEDGLSSLTDIESPLEGRVGMGQGHLVVRATPVTLDAGTASSASEQARFGSGEMVSQNPAIGAGAQRASGVGLSIGYQTNGLTLDAGATPRGFRESNVVGGAKVQIPFSQQTQLTLEASRRAVTDSLLSYAGAVDERTGRSWGGVTATGGRGQLTWDDGTNGAYVYGSFHELRGNGVESNSSVEGGGGYYTRVIKEGNQELKIGANISYISYDRNLGYFTFGQGGYFSPQQFAEVSIPFEWRSKSGSYTFDVRGALAVQQFREDNSNYYPNDPALQAQALASGSGIYYAQSKTGLGYSLFASAEYQASPQIFLGGYVGADNVRDYAQYQGGLYIRYSLTKIASDANMSPRALQSPYLIP